MRFSPCQFFSHRQAAGKLADGKTEIWIQKYRLDVTIRSVGKIFLGCWFSIFFCNCRINQAALVESFETTEPSWKLAEADCGVRLTSQQRLVRDAHSGQGCEYLQIRAGNGSFVYITHLIDRASLITELDASVWVNSDRPGIQLLTRVVLPRSRDPVSGRPLTTLLRGNLYERVGTWQQLRIDNLASVLAKQIPVLRQQFGKEVDPREAYVDLIVLNIYGGTGITNVRIDDMELAGHVLPGNLANDQRAENSLAIKKVAFNKLPYQGQTADQQNHGAGMRGWVLEVNGQPLMVRMVQYNGESFESLGKLGFNTIKLESLPTRQQLEQARRHHLWLVAPPPQIAQNQTISTVYDRVLAWYLGGNLTYREIETIRQIANAVRRADPQSGRPIICSADDNLWQYSRIADILLVTRSPLGSSMEMSDYRSWLNDRNRLARSGTPLWASIPTELDSSLLTQIAIDQPSTIEVDCEKVRLMTYHALAAATRGFYFPSQRPLDGPDASSKYRRQTLQLVNQELSVLAPWAVAGNHLSGVDSLDQSYHVSVLKTERSRLAIVLRDVAYQQYVASPAQNKAFSFVIPNVPASSQAYVVTPVSVKPPKNRRRVAGGLRITLSSVSRVSLVVLTEDPLVVSHLSRHLAEHKQQVAFLQYKITAHRFTMIDNIYRILAGQNQSLPSAGAWLQESLASLQQAKRLIEAGDPESGYELLKRADRSLSKICRGHWQQAVRDFPSPATSPYCACFSTLPTHWQMAGKMRTAQWSHNALAEGNMENLQQMTLKGWEHFRRADSGLSTEVELSPRQIHTGRSALHLVASVAPQTESPAVVEAAPVWINSAPVSVHAGQLVRIHGWVKIPDKISGSHDGLMIFDSISGPALAERIDHCPQWREFTLYRRARQHGALKITFALTGIGEVWLDDVSVILLESMGAASSPLERSIPQTGRK